MFIDNIVILDNLMSSLKPEDKETPRISPGSVQCTWKVEELFTNEVQKASHNLDKDCAEVKSKIITVSQTFMRHLRDEIKAKRHNYAKIKLVKFFMAASVGQLHLWVDERQRATRP